MCSKLMISFKMKQSDRMSGEKELITGRRPEEPYRITKERLAGTNTYLISFLFPVGVDNAANFYVFSYENGGVAKHTFIDAGDSRYQKQILAGLAANHINPANIERIIITHRHPDHCSLAALLARESKTKILAHPNFKSLIDKEVGEEEQGWWKGWDIDPSRFRELDIEYLLQTGNTAGRSIDGLDFPILGKPIEIGEGAKLEILACPESIPTHSPDQIIVLYSPFSYPQASEKTGKDIRPTDDILFTGDLWLMTGPLTRENIKNHWRYVRHRLLRLKNRIFGKEMVRRDPREQDSRATEALKKGFCLIRAKPGHGEEFIGGRIIPHSLLAERDLLLELGFSGKQKQSLLSSGDVAPKIASIKEQAYTFFVKELLIWTELGYTWDEILELLVRIYKEQSGGGRLVEKDRKQRRERLKATLTRLKDDKTKHDELHDLAEFTLSRLKES
ncbi:MBL fold metallo-hydrolase [Chloroflexota bacterium]